MTPREHLGLPDEEDVRQGVIASRIAAHAADVALGLGEARKWDDKLSAARARLDWSEHLKLAMDPETAQRMHEEKQLPDTDHCTMCGKEWCSVRISKKLRESTTENKNVNSCKT